MIIKYTEYIKENNNSQFFKTYEETKDWLDLMKIKNYTINKDLTVNVNGNLQLINKNLTIIPVQFEMVNGFFTCTANNLTTCIGFPKEVKGFINCEQNIITSLIDISKKIHGTICLDHNRLTSFIGLPKEYKGEIDCFHNKLTSLDGLSIGSLKKIINNERNWYKRLIPTIKEDYFDKHLEENPEIISLINFELSDSFKDKWDYLLNANKFDLI